MNKIEHIGIAVKSLEISNEVFAKILNTSPYKSEEVISEGVNTSFFKMGDSKIELLEATKADSPIAKFIEKKGEGIHHIAFEGADNKLVCFLHPKSSNGVLIELCQEIK
jgi:methylmalonyl-CoA/ethylmalonyl-CoA epimerase